MLMTLAGFILGLLKIMLLIIAALVGLVIIIVLLILFSPIRYKIDVKKDGTDDDLSFNSKIWWTFGLVSLRVRYPSKNNEYFVLRILGINIGRFRNLLSFISRKKKSVRDGWSVKNKNREIFSGGAAEDTFDKTLYKTPDKFSGEDGFTQEKKPAGKSVILKFLKKIKLFFLRIYRAFKALKDIVCNVINFLDNTNNIAGIRAIFGAGKDVLKCVMPKYADINICFGIEDPYRMGQVLSVLGIFYGLYGSKINIIPKFDEGTFIWGNAVIKGKIRIFTLLKIWIKLYKNENFMSTYENLKKLYI